MSEKSLANKLLNPRGIKHPIVKGVLLGAATAVPAGIVISGWLHRSTHGGVEYSERAKKVWRGANLVFTGMPKIDWVDHLAHHAFPDKYDQAAHEKWNKNRPQSAPLAPAEAFRDPYSVKLEGYMSVLFNTAGLHRKAKKQIVPFLHGLDAFDKSVGNDALDRSHWPEPYRRVDMKEADPKAFRNRYPYMGLVALGVGEAVAFGPAVAIPAVATHIGALFGMAGDINAINHTGQRKGFINRSRVLIGIDQPIPAANGSLAANLLVGNEGITEGEAHHEYHHENPQDPFLAGANLRRDPAGLIIKMLVRTGDAAVPGAHLE
jgi:hypothetical protein